MSMQKKTNRELRKFGITIAIAFAIFGGLFLFRGKPAGFYLLAIAGFFFVFGLIWPRVLAPVEWVWMKFAHALGYVMTRVLLTLTFYLFITPMGLVMRLFGKDLLNLKFVKDSKSYWVPVDPEGPTSRVNKPY